jgi:hypothetical protein
VAGAVVSRVVSVVIVHIAVVHVPVIDVVRVGGRRRCPKDINNLKVITIYYLYLINNTILIEIINFLSIYFFPSCLA